MKCFETLHPDETPLQLAWYLKAMCHALEEVRLGRNDRLVITVPPRHLKSITASVAFAAWLLGNKPSLKILVASYSQDLARAHSEQTRTILESDWYQSLYPETRIRVGGNRQLELITTAGGYRKAVSVGGSVTGHGADIIIVDDLMKADDVHSEAAREEALRWFSNSLVTRLNAKKTGAIISIQQRLHEDDLPAHQLEQSYRHLNLPAIGETVEEIAVGLEGIHVRRPGDLLNPDREDQEVLDRMRRELGPQVFSAQYQQNPVAPEGNLIRPEWFGRYEEPIERHMFRKVVQSWDTAESADPRCDFSVGMTWGLREDRWWLLDIFRKRLDYPDLKRAVIRLYHQWKPDKVIIEDANSGKSLYQELKISGPFKPIVYRPTRNKETRLIGQTGRLEDGLCLLPVEAPWLDDFIRELKAFPNGRHDDQIDSLTQFLEFEHNNWRWALAERTPEGRLVEPIRLKKRPPLSPRRV